MTREMIDPVRLIEGLDSDLPLDRLLPVRDAERLVAHAQRLLEVPVRLLAPDGTLLGGVPSLEATTRRPLLLDFEPVALLESGIEGDRLEAMAQWLEWWLGKQQKYLLASNMHHAVVESDFEQLQARNRELEVSEARYRELAAQLEKRVQAQVKLIKTAERKLYAQEKLASVGQLAAGMAHEINNPIGFVTSNLHMAKDYLAELEGYIAGLESERASVPEGHQALVETLADFSELLTESSEGCRRVAEIVRNLKDFSNVDGTEQARESVNTLIERVCDLHRNRLPDTVTLTLRLEVVPPVMLLVGHMAQVLANLLSNALQAVQDQPGGRISFASSVCGDRVRIRVADNGCGMDEATRRRAFEPFFTTRAVGRGTGLGLSVCRDTVLAHQGHIELVSAPGRGTLVTIELPVATS